jgi:hypothetical protein
MLDWSMFAFQKIQKHAALLDKNLKHQLSSLIEVILIEPRLN